MPFQQREVFISTKDQTIYGRAGEMLGVKKGQMIFSGNSDAIVRYSNYEAVIGMDIPNVMRITQYNCATYGMCHSGGSYYTLRKPTSLYDANGVIRFGLPSGYKVVFASGQGYTSSVLGYDYIRCNGYMDQNGVFHETTGLYCYCNSYCTDPVNYEVNTI